MKQALVLALVGAALGGPVFADDQPAPAAPALSCARVKSIRNWEPIDQMTAYIFTTPRTRFKVTFFGPCMELKRGDFSRIDTGGSRHMCLSPGDQLIVGQQLSVPERCVIKTIEPAPFDAPAEPAKTP